MQPQLGTPQLGERAISPDQAERAAKLCRRLSALGTNILRGAIPARWVPGGAPRIESSHLDTLS